MWLLTYLILFVISFCFFLFPKFPYGFFFFPNLSFLKMSSLCAHLHDNSAKYKTSGIKIIVSGVFSSNAQWVRGDVGILPAQGSDASQPSLPCFCARPPRITTMVYMSHFHGKLHFITKPSPICGCPLFIIEEMSLCITLKS